jgi:twitching motility protein PilT
MDLYEIVAHTVQLNGSDIFIVPGSPIVAKCMGRHVQITQEKLMPSDTEILLREIYEMSANRSLEDLFDLGDDDFSFSITGLGRFRCNAFRQRGSLAAVLRVVALGLPNPQLLGIPDSVMALCAKKRGLVLVTGPACSGKSTTLACMIDQINHQQAGHIITIEDPIEHLHPHGLSIVSQREVRSDTSTFQDALRAALRQAPDVILLGEMRDHELIQTAMHAAETGHLILSSMHTVGAARTVERIIDSFPPNQRPPARLQLSMVLEAVVSQQLIPTLCGQIAPVFEIMNVNEAVRAAIREDKIHQIDNVIQSGTGSGMRAMDDEMLGLYHEGVISRENAIMFASNPDAMAGRI